MEISKIRCTCQSCNEVFDAELVVGAPLAVAVASMQAVRCPSCGSSECGLGGSCRDFPPTTAPITDRIQWWQGRGEHGVSSETIFAAFTASRPRRADIPYDPDDFRRCRQLLVLIPEWRADLSPLTRAYPWYKPFVDAWDEMDRLYDLAPEKLYDLMKRLETESREIRREA